MAKKKIGSILIVAAFVVILCFSWLIWIFAEKYVGSTNHENREMAIQPRLTADAYETFAVDYDAYFNDAMPFRNQLITLNTAIDYFCFKKSTNSKVIAGKDDWLFYSSVIDGDPIGCYQGTNLFTEETLAAVAENLVNQRDYLQEQGVEFVLFIAPNKERIYSENMPERYGEPADLYAAKQLVDYLRANTDLRVVYPYDELMEAKSLLEENIYCKTDTHWNELGGYVGARALLEELGIDMPKVEDLTIEATGVYGGDLAAMLNLTNQLKHDQSYDISGYETHNIQTTADDFYQVFSYTAENADPRRVYVRRDSFSTAMRLIVGSQFAETYMRHTGTYTFDDYAAYQPDVFVYELVERSIGNLEHFSVQ